jgi:hypothetical protein
MSASNRSTFNKGNVESSSLIIVRITLKEPKTGLAGVMLQNSFAKFDASMATSSEERTTSRRFCRRASESMGSKPTWYEETLQRADQGIRTLAETGGNRYNLLGKAPFKGTIVQRADTWSCPQISS